MTGKHIHVSGSTWIHQDKPNKDLAFMTLVVGLGSLIVVCFLRPNVEAVLDTLLLVALVTLAVFLSQARTANVEIDLDNGTVRKTADYLVFTKRKTYPLQEFDSISMLVKDEPAEDGYRMPRYSVVLSGKSRTLELLSTDTETEGKAIQKELAEFLGLPSQGESNRRSKK